MKEVTRETGVSVNEAEKPYKPNFFEQALNVFSAYSFCRMRQLYELNNRSASAGAAWANEIVNEQRNELGPFFGITQSISTIDLRAGQRKENKKLLKAKKSKDDVKKKDEDKYKLTPTKLKRAKVIFKQIPISLRANRSSLFRELEDMGFLRAFADSRTSNK